MSSKKVTSILDCIDTNDLDTQLVSEDKKVEKKYNDDTECFFDYDCSLDIRINAFKNICINNPLQSQEIISDLCSSFIFSPVESILDIITSLLYLDELEIPIKVVLSTTVYNVEETRDKSYHLFFHLLNEMMSKKELYNSTLYVDILKYIITREYKSFDENLVKIKEFCYFMCNYCEDIVYKNQIYRNIYNMYKEEKYYESILLYSMICIKNSCDDRLKIIIINQLYLILEKANILEYTDSDLINELLTVVDNNTDENTIADVADLLLRFNNTDAKQKGMEILSRLEGIKGRRSFYQNSQNIHHINIDNNLQEFINFLSSNQSLVVVQGSDEEFYQKIKHKLLELSEHNVKVLQALNRIYLDPTYYGGFSILTILIKCWLVIENHEHKDELLKRVIEELIDMSETCSTGHLLRLSNIFSGFGFQLKMDIQKEMRSKISHIVNKQLKKESDDEQLDLIDNMTSEEEMNKFCKFFMRHVEYIKSELLNDYKDILDRDEFEEMFRKELVFFETNGK
jgi:hypothetical protein